MVLSIKTQHQHIVTHADKIIYSVIMYVLVADPEQGLVMRRVLANQNVIVVVIAISMKRIKGAIFVLLENTQLPMVWVANRN